MKGIAIFLFVLTLGIVPQSLQAQEAYGTIVGSVTDSSGAVVPNANVTVTNVGTGVASKVATGAAGEYSVPNLFPGAYQVTVETVGFKSFVATALTLHVDQQLRVDAVLQPGAVTTRMEVTATAGQLIETDTSTIGKVVENKEIVDLPLVSRNFIALAALSGGAINEPATTSGENTAIIPAETTGTFRTGLAGGGLWVAGGRDDANSYYIDGLENNDPGFQTIAVTPPIDAIEEFKIMNQDYTAEFGRGLGQVQIAIKSGSNKFHGTGYDFFRNDVLDARGFFDYTNPVTNRSKGQLRYNQFGGSLGGPIKRDKWFFFGDYEGTRNHTFNLQEGTMPTTAELSGDFSADAPIYNYVTGVQYPGNNISNLIDPKIAKIIAEGMFAPPNTSLPGDINEVAYLVTPDTINIETVRVDGKISDRDSLFARATIQNENIVSPSVYPLSGGVWIQNGRSVALGFNHLFSPRVINELRVGFVRPFSSQSLQSGFKGAAQDIFTGMNTAPNELGTPTLIITGYGTYGSRSFAPYAFLTNSYSFADTLTYTRGRHSIRMGIEFYHWLYNDVNSDVQRGNFYFSGLFTQGPLNPSGNGMADFLLGLTDFARDANGGNQAYLHSISPNLFIQDDWKVSARLTLNLGLRWEYREPYTEAMNRVSGVDLTYPGGRICTPNPQEVALLNDPYLVSDCPRGIMNPDYRDYGPRVGFAYRPFASNNTVLRGGFGIFYGNYQSDENTGIDSVPYTTAFSRDYTPQNPPDLDALFPAPVTPAPYPPISGTIGMDRNTRLPYTEQWSFDVQRLVGSDWVLDVGYLGNSSKRLNARLPQYQGVLATPGDVSSIVFPYYNIACCFLDESANKGNYEALNLRVEKHFSRGFYMQTAYSWSHNLSIDSETIDEPQYMWDRNADYGNTNFDVRQRLVISATYELPFGRGNHFGSGLSGVADKLTRGWQANGIYQIQSGFWYPISAVDESETEGTYNSFRADLVGNPHAPDRIDPTRAFNRSAFAQPAVGYFGDLGNDTMNGKGINNFDFSLFKNTFVSERFNVQFRAEFFNLWNHTQLGPFPGSSISNEAALGVYTTIQHAPRVAQMAIKLIF